jgi:hypothetical protein
MKRLLFLACSLVIGLSSCVKRQDTPVGNASVKFVNAVDKSNDQDVYAGGKLLSRGPLGYGFSTEYFTVPSGFTIFEYTNTGTQEIQGQINHGMDIDSYSTIYYYRDLNSLIQTGATRDDMTAPPAGKARVRFIHLNYYFNNSINVGVVGAAAPLAKDLVFRAASGYFNVDPGTKFQASGTGIVTAPVIDVNIQAGKIYTIWIDGESGTNLRPHTVLQN